MKEKTWDILAIALIFATLASIFLWWWGGEVRTNRELKCHQTSEQVEVTI